MGQDELWVNSAYLPGADYEKDYERADGTARIEPVLALELDPGVHETGERQVMPGERECHGTLAMSGSETTTEKRVHRRPRRSTLGRQRDHSDLTIPWGQPRADIIDVPDVCLRAARVRVPPSLLRRVRAGSGW